MQHEFKVVIKDPRPGIPEWTEADVLGALVQLYGPVRDRGVVFDVQNMKKIPEQQTFDLAV